MTDQPTTGLTHATITLTHNDGTVYEFVIDTDSYYQADIKPDPPLPAMSGPIHGHMDLHITGTGMVRTFKATGEPSPVMPEAIEGCTCRMESERIGEGDWTHRRLHDDNCPVHGEQ